jgi:quinolinate synthase
VAPEAPAGTSQAAGVQQATQEIGRRVAGVIPPLEWSVHAAHVSEILLLKAELGAVVLAHNYMPPEIFHTVADFGGDSLTLARHAARTDAPVVVMAGVRFMAETAKLLNPDKVVLLPHLGAGCSLADSIGPEDVRRLRARHPGVPVVAYVNTSAEVKAEADICCTSANAVEVVESLGVARVIFLPDEYLGRYVASRTGVELVLWRGRCEVHERFTGEEVSTFRGDYPGIRVLAHPECSPEVLAQADYVGSTSGMARDIRQARPARAVLVTERSMSDNLALEFPEVGFVRPWALCPHMKRITLPGIARSLRTMSHRIEVAPEVAERARQALERMLAVGAGERP